MNTPISSFRPSELRPLGSLLPNPRNARTHPKSQLAKLVAAISQFGFRNPILIDALGMILCGHGRYLAAVELGLTHVPVLVVDDLSPADLRALVLADNAIADKGGYDRSLLRSELKYLADIGYEVELTGYDTLEIDTMLSLDDERAAAEDDDDQPIPVTNAAPVTRVGDLYTIGVHRMIVGNACDPMVIERLMDGGRAQLVFTDPPYGCAITNNVSGLGRVVHDNFVQGAGQETLPELAMTILRPAFRNIAAHCAPGAIAFVCSDWRAATHMLDAARGVFLEVKNWIVFVKSNAGMGTFYRSQFELIFAFKVSPGKHINNFGLGEGGRHRSNVWTYAGANSFRAGRMEDLAAHPTVKSRKLVADAILDCSRRGGIVLDVFAGSGTTLSAAEVTGRRGYGVELDPKYADVILARVSEVTGKVPLLDGVTPFPEVAAQRRAERGEIS